MGKLALNITLSRGVPSYPKKPESSGTSVVPISATPPPAMSCLIPWDFTDVR